MLVTSSVGLLSACGSPGAAPTATSAPTSLAAAPTTAPTAPTNAPARPTAASAPAAATVAPASGAPVIVGDVKLPTYIPNAGARYGFARVGRRHDRRQLQGLSEHAPEVGPVRHLATAATSTS